MGVFMYPMGFILGFIRDLYKSHGLNQGLIGLNVGFISEKEGRKKK
jgi:hypothetical protein